MLSVGILTFHDALNYGAVLQAYALSEKYRELGADTKVINYVCKQIKKSSDYKCIIKSRSFPKGLVVAIFRSNLITKFAKFKKKYLPLTEQIVSRELLSQISSRFNIIVTGSDQVWNDNLTDGDSTFLLDIENYKGEKYSYAASFGYDRLPESLIERYRMFLSKYSAISVREKSAENIVIKQLCLSCRQNIDPTLLIKAEDWLKIAKFNKHKKGFVFLYLVPIQEEVIEYAKKFAYSKGLQLILGNRTLRFPKIKHAGAYAPDEFIGYIHDADYVITNSFHGTAFSIIFKKKFTIFLNNPRGYNIRSRDLLAKCGIVNEDYKCKTFVSNKIDWKKVDNIIDEEICKSMDYLAMTLNVD